MKNLARLMQLESITRLNNQEPNFYFIEDPSNESRPHYTAMLELAGWTVLADEGESISSLINDSYNSPLTTFKIPA